MKTKTTCGMEGKFQLTLSEEEARALDALAGYGADAFLKAFYKHMGRAYMEPHEAGLRSLFGTIGGLSHGIGRLDTARAVFNGRKVAVSPESVEFHKKAALATVEPREAAPTPEKKRLLRRLLLRLRLATEALRKDTL